MILTFHNLIGGYHDNQTVIRGISSRFGSGDFVGIIGPNGSGKTTLLRMLSGVLPPAEGRVFFDSEDIYRMKSGALSKKAAFVPQDIQVNFSFSVKEFVLLGRIPHLGRFEWETREDYEIADNSLRITDTLYLKEKRINSLSGGERQRVFIAKALAQHPVLLFLDEPTSHLDIGHKIQILDLLRRLNGDGRLTIVMVLHDLNLAAEYCNRIILLDQGRIYKEGQAQEVITYQNIEKVYKTIVVESKNPITLKPFIIPVSRER